MAEVSISFKIDGIEQEVKSVDDLNKAMTGLTKATKEQDSAEQKASQSAKESAKQADQSETSIALQAAAESGDKVKFQKLRGQLDELNDELDKTRLQSGQLDDQLTQLPGAAGVAGNAFKGLNDTIKIFLANPLLAVITAVVGAFLLMKKSLESTAEGQAVLNKISQAFSGILGPILALVEKVAVPVFSKLGDALGLVAKGFSWAAQAVGISSAKIKESTLSVDEVQQKANEAEKKRAEDAKKIADDKKAKAAELKKTLIANQQAINDKLKDLNNELIKDTEKKGEELLKTEYERTKRDFQAKGASKKQLLELEKDYQTKLQNYRTDFAKQDYDAFVKASEDLEAKDKEQKDKEKERAKSAVDYINSYRVQVTVRGYQDLRLAINNAEDEQLAIAKEKLDSKLLTEEEYNKSVLAINTQFNDQRKQASIDNQAEIDQIMADHRQTQLENSFEIEAENIAIEEQNTLAELDRLSATEEKKQQIREYYAGLQGDLQKKKAENDLKYTAAALGQLKDFLGEGTDASKIAGSAQALINTYLGASQAIADPTMPTWLKFITVPLIIASGLKQVQAINAAETPKFEAGGPVTGGAHTQGGVPIFAEGGEFIINKYAMQSPGVADMAAALNGVNSPTNFAASTSGQTQVVAPVIKAYVVSDDVTSQQEATTKIQRLAKL
jgi:hypothetical protein